MQNLDQPNVVLLAEGDPIVGVDLSDALVQASYRVLGPADTTAEALRLLEQVTPNLAVLVVQLKDGRCTQLIRELRARNVPILVHSGSRQDQRLNGDVRGAPWLTKPAVSWDVIAALDELSLSSAAIARAEPGPEDAPLLRLVQSADGSRNPLVRKLERFTTLTATDRAMLERISAGTHDVAPHTDLVREGEAPEGVFLVMEGVACRHKHRANGHRQIMAYLLPGDLCDLDAALLKTMDHTITTLSACRVVRIAPPTLAGLLEHHPAIARGLRMNTLVDEATLREWLMNLGGRSPQERIAHLFCELLVRWQTIGLASGQSYLLPLTAADLADTTGLSTVHVNRALQALRHQGVIDLTGGHLTILNLPRLKALGEFRANYLHLGDCAAA
ncbi:helix-turn-helix domain-containing protein [Methylobacterium flocculans]|uniref:helix-turn-helix domain-containing protein n=1 Tax=Methylobacterium flocculans TaxID=2984843 RepID=UPI0021F39A33|nr:helix-turn-helix domain-containing protein [Methylobacterium sp. FF17]